MIVIQQDVWRAECIAGFGFNSDEDAVRVFPVNCTEPVPYIYEDSASAKAAYKAVLEAWKRELAEGKR